MHAQTATPSLTAHAWCGPHATALIHWPSAPHVCTPLAEHWVVPRLHATQLPPTQYGVLPLHAVAQLPSDASVESVESEPEFASELAAESRPPSPVGDVESMAPSDVVVPSSPASPELAPASRPPSDW